MSASKRIYGLEIMDKAASDYGTPADMYRSEAIAAARDAAADKRLQVYIYFRHSDDGDTGYLNPDLNHEITGKPWTVEDAKVALAEIAASATAARSLGRKGGSVKSEAKAKSSPANGAKGGRPPLDPEQAKYIHDEAVKYPVGQSSRSGLWGWARVSGGLDLSACSYKTELAAKRARNRALALAYWDNKRTRDDAAKGIY